MNREKSLVQPISWVLELTRQILQSIDTYTRHIFSKITMKNGGIDASSLQLAQIAIGLEPEMLGIAHIFSRLPYSNPASIRSNFQKAVASGWLIFVREGVYRASIRSHDVYYQVNRDVEQVYRQLNPMPSSQLEQIDTTLKKVVNAIRDDMALCYKPSFDLDLKLGKTGGPVLQRICCKLSHLMAYRDDSYVNAWMHQDVNSYVWETFSCIYKGKAQTESGISNLLGSLRNYDILTYKAALSELVDRTWITLEGGNYEPTQDGIKTLAQVARDLNQMFFEPWGVLPVKELSTLRELLFSLGASIKVQKPKHGIGYANINRTIGWGSIQWMRDNAC